MVAKMTVVGKVFVTMNLDNVGAFMDIVVSFISCLPISWVSVIFFLRNCKSKSVRYQKVVVTLIATGRLMFFF